MKDSILCVSLFLYCVIKQDNFCKLLHHVSVLLLSRMCGVNASVNTELQESLIK